MENTMIQVVADLKVELAVSRNRIQELQAEVTSLKQQLREVKDAKLLYIQDQLKYGGE